MKTESAQVAALIRAELKKEFPGVKFQVHSKTYSGGDSVTVRYELTETTPTPAQVEKIAFKYQAGHFDGMTDMYEYNSERKGVTAKFVFVSADATALEEKYKPSFLKHWGLTAFEDNEIMKKMGLWKEQALHRYVMREVVGV